MEKIYLVTSGEYSDYGVDAVFTSEEEAQMYIDAFGKQDSYQEMGIEERVLNPRIEQIRKGYKPFFLRMDKEGNAYQIDESNSQYGFGEYSNELGFAINDNMYIYLFAKDKNHAAKIANEKRVQLIANNKWGREAYNERS